MSRFTTVLAGATLALAALTGTASAQQFPDKPIQLMVAHFRLAAPPTLLPASSRPSPRRRSGSRSSWSTRAVPAVRSDGQNWCVRSRTAIT